MQFDWDAVKEAANRRKHGVSFEDAKEAIRSPLAITISDPAHSQEEEREKTIGPTRRKGVLIISHTECVNDVIRIISARKADKREVRDYEEEIRQRFSTWQ